MGALGFRQRLAALVASVHEQDLASPSSKNLHRDPSRTARTYNECGTTTSPVRSFLFRSLFDHGLECLAIGVLPAQLERLARGARPEQRVDRLLAGFFRAREKR